MKALADPKDASLFDKVIASKSNTITNMSPSTVNVDQCPVPPKEIRLKHRSSLLDQMLAEDDTEANDLKPPKAGDGNNSSSAVTEPLEKVMVLTGTIDQDDSAATKSLAIVPAKKRGGGSLWKKLLWRKKVSAKK